MLHAILFFSASIKDVYHLKELLGQGSFGIVYRAIRKEDGLICALKKIALPVDEQKMLKKEREAKTLYNLHHKNIIKCFPPTYRFEEGAFDECKL